MPEDRKIRLKDMNSRSKAFYDTLNDNSKAFIDEYRNITGKNLNITSGRRNASQGIGKNSSISHHNTGNAFDISSEHIDDYDFLINKREGLELMKKYGLGIIDETNPETMKKTGATEAHFHIGKDSKYVNQIEDRLKQLGNGNISTVYSYSKWIKEGRNPSEFSLEGHFEGDGHNHDGIALQTVEDVANGNVDQYQGFDYNDENFKRAVQEQVEATKRKENKDRAELEKESNERVLLKQRMEAVLNAYNYTPQNEQIDSNREVEDVPIQMNSVDIQRDLPQFQNIFTI